MFPDAAFEESLAALAADGSIVTTWGGGEEDSVSVEAGAGAGAEEWSIVVRQERS